MAVPYNLCRLLLSSCYIFQLLHANRPVYEQCLNKWVVLSLACHAQCKSSSFDWCEHLSPYLLRSTSICKSHLDHVATHPCASHCFARLLLRTFSQYVFLLAHPSASVGTHNIICPTQPTFSPYETCSLLTQALFVMRRRLDLSDGDTCVL